MILPEAMLGMLGGGQLGRMFTLAAHSMGYRVTVLDPDPLSPAGHIADLHIKAAYQDREALEQLADSCAAVTTEFENVPADSLRYLAQHCPVSPGGDSVAVCQDRIREKEFFLKCGLGATPYAVIRNAEDLEHCDASLFPGILKRSRFGYDGKGQVAVTSQAGLGRAFAALSCDPCVLEQLQPLQSEVSAIVARAADGDIASFPLAENRHRSGILDVSIVPARIDPTIERLARAQAASVAERLGYCGVLAVEFFVLADGQLFANEMAPRPHNSGHFTIDACATSQFEQQVRTMCGLPLGDPRLLSPAVMVNLLGDLWMGRSPPLQNILSDPRTKLHLYGKHETRPRRKMGHYTCLGESAESALSQALKIQQALLPRIESVTA